MDFDSESFKSIPETWRGRLANQFAEGEELVGWFEPDLDAELRYAAELIVLTTHRLLACSSAAGTWPPSAVPPSAHDANGHPSGWQSWPLSAELKLHTSEQAGAGTLELSDQHQRLAWWRYTAARGTLARQFEARRKTEQARRSEGENQTATAPLPTVCPSCGEVITSSDGVCAACAPAPPPAPVSALFRLLVFAKPRAAMVVLGLLLTVAGSAAALLPPYLTKPLINDVLTPRQEGQLVDVRLVYVYLSLIFGAAIVAWLLNWGRLYVTSWVSEQIVSDLRKRTYGHLQQLSLEFFGGKRTGDLMARISSDADRISIYLSVSLVDFINDLMMIVLAAALLLQMDMRLAVCTLVTFPIIVWLVYFVKQRLRHGFNQSAVALGHLNSVLADTIPGIRVVKAFAQERREIERFDQANDYLLSINNRLNRVWSFFGPLVSLLTDLGLLGVWAFGTWLIFTQGPGAPNALDVGTLVAFVLLITRFYGRLETIIRIVYSTQKAAASANRVFEILDRVPSVPEPVKPVHPGRLDGRLELRGVRFKYGTREVLHGLDLQIESGEMIGLVGPSGAGKSTLINLICRFFDVADGAILADGVDIRSYPVQEYRKNIGIVLQDPFLFFGTIAENIAYGRSDASRQEVVAAARAARAHEFILNLTDGYDSLVGERGQSLSGGERQRISIARALLIDPRILILDEATSSVDTETEREIQIALSNLIRGRTTIAIAHRLSTLRKADRLVVIERGRIVEIGKHAELLGEEGAYARLHKAQMDLVQGIGV